MGGREILDAGEPILFIDRKNRSYLRVLRPGALLTVRGGTFCCDDLIGRSEGSMVRNSDREAFFVCRPTYAQLAPKLPRNAQVIYPKDVGPILLWGDIRSGNDVVEIGTGPGAMTIALLRAVGPTGRLTSYEIRQDFAEMARRNVNNFFGEAPNWTLKVADAFAGLDERGVDRLLVDLAEPWRLVHAAATTLRPGGIFVVYVPTTPQLKEIADALRAHGGFTPVEAMETLMRFWHVAERSVRPEHRMVAHTGFLVIARRRAPSDSQPTRNCFANEDEVSG